MPAWITSLLRDEVSEPMSSCCSKTTTSWPAALRVRATARPTTPAPTTMVSTSARMAPRAGCRAIPTASLWQSSLRASKSMMGEASPNFPAPARSTVSGRRAIGHLELPSPGPALSPEGHAQGLGTELKRSMQELPRACANLSIIENIARTKVIHYAPLAGKRAATQIDRSHAGPRRHLQERGILMGLRQSAAPSAEPHLHAALTR